MPVKLDRIKSGLIYLIFSRFCLTCEKNAERSVFHVIHTAFDVF